MDHSKIISIALLKALLLLGGVLLFNSAMGQTWSQRFEFPFDTIPSGNAGYGVENTETGYVVYQQGYPGLNHPTGQHVGFLTLNFDGSTIGTSQIGQLATNFFTGRPNCSANDNNEIISSLTTELLEGAFAPYASLVRYEDPESFSIIYEHDAEDYYECESVQFASPQGYILGGTTENSPDNLRSAFLIKLDANAELEWETIVMGQNNEFIQTDVFGSNVINAHDGGYLLTAREQYSQMGTDCVFQGFRNDRVVYKFDAQGVLQWTKKWENCYIEPTINIVPTSDGNYVLCQGTVIPEISNPDNVRYRLNLIKIDENGDEIWDRMYGPHTTNSYLRSVKELEDGSLIAVGHQRWTPNPQPNAVILKTTADGDSLWMRTHQWEAGVESVFNDVIADGEGGFVACGHVRGGEGYFGQDTWVVRMDSLGCILPGCHVGVEEEMSLATAFEVFPNPAQTEVNLSFPQGLGASTQLHLLDIAGKEVLQATIPTGTLQWQLQVGTLPKGMYVLRLVNEEATRSKRVVLE